MEGELPDRSTLMKRIATHEQQHMTDYETDQQQVMATLIRVHEYQQKYMAQIKKALK